MQEGEVPGLSIAVIRNGKLAWHQNFGVMNAETKQPVSDDTIFEAASLTKPLFAYAVMKLVVEGKLDLDAPLSKYLSEPYVPDDEQANKITARLVLSHRTGLPNEVQRGQTPKLYYTPGERFSYSGEGFLYLQKVVEKIAGEPLETFARKTVFEPLGMKDSSFVWQERYERSKANGHKPSGQIGQIRKPSVAKGYATLHTTILDYAKFVAAVLNKTGLKKGTLEQMLKPQVQVDEACVNCLNREPANLSRTISWGLGWGLEQTEKGQAFWQWGDNNSEFHNFVMAYPGEKKALVVFTNSGNGHSIIPEIVSQVLGDDHPVFSWVKYEPYNSPAKTFLRDILSRGDAAIREYRESLLKNASAMALDENQINYIGYMLLGKKRIQEAIEIFKMNVENYPLSANTYDSLGEAYMISGDKEMAIKNYKKSLDLNPDNTNAAQMLKRLQDK